MKLRVLRIWFSSLPQYIKGIIQCNTCVVYDPPDTNILEYIEYLSARIKRHVSTNQARGLLLCRVLCSRMMALLEQTRQLEFADQCGYLGHAVTGTRR